MPPQAQFRTSALIAMLVAVVAIAVGLDRACEAWALPRFIDECRRGGVTEAEVERARALVETSLVRLAAMTSPSWDPLA